MPSFTVGDLIKQKDDGSYAMQTTAQLTGSIVDEHILLDAEAVTGSGNSFTESVDLETLKQYRYINVVVIDTLDASVEIRAWTPTSAGTSGAYRYFDGETWSIPTISTPENSGVRYLIASFNAEDGFDKIFGGNPNAFFAGLRFRYGANTEPTSGSLTIKILGVK
ncbi:hypothetical protein [Alkalicoccus chagannorensis]|uniref:hypothetical protein n=1 Tax=Alkalicoccus chagannorensis TaxID=427072 RepID=UPI00047B9D16|nr:hypothetical protein [Alkalicoccus chagannorensis]